MYWASSQKGGWGRIAIDGAATAQLGSKGTSAGSIAWDGASLLGTTWDGAIARVPLDGSPPTPWPTPDDDVVGAIVADGVNAYWAMLAEGTIRQRALAGGDTITLATGQHVLNEVRAFGGNVYWSTFGSGNDHGSIRAVPIGGGAVNVLTSVDASPVAFAVDASGVYWIDSVSLTWITRLMRLRHGATIPEVLVSGEKFGWGLAVDEMSVYWTTSLDDTHGALRRVVK